MSWLLAIAEGIAIAILIAGAATLVYAVWFAWPILAQLRP